MMVMIPPKITAETARRLNFKPSFRKEEKNEGIYSWISVYDGSIGCKMEKWCGTALQVFSYTGY